MRILLAALFLMLQSGAALADALEGLLSNLPDHVIKKLQKPDRLLEDGTALILGYGVAGQIDRAGISKFIDARRADVRAREIRRLLAADLNGDMAVSEDELSVLIGAASASRRGRLLLNFRATDENADGSADFAEITRRANMRAFDDLNEADAKALYDLLHFDLNSDGHLSLDELVRTIRAYQSFDA